MAAAYQYMSHRFDELRERDHRTLVFGELTYSREIGSTELLAGVAYQRDALRQTDFPAFDFTYSVPSLFGQLRFRPSERVTAILSGRCDRHNTFGTFCSPSGAVLVRPSQAVEARLTAAAGYRAPTTLDGEVEVLGLHTLAPRTFNAERLQTAALDVTWHRNQLELGTSVNFLRITRALRVVPVPNDPAGRLRLENAAAPTRIGSIQLTAGYRLAPFAAGAYYQYARGTEVDPVLDRRRLVAPDSEPFRRRELLLGRGGERHPDRRRGQLRRAQAVWDNPRRTRTPGYSLVHVLVSQRTGRARLYLSGENVFDVRLADYEPVFFATPEDGGRLTAAPWVSLRGRVISLGALIDW